MDDELRAAFDSQWYRPFFHLTPPTGWMNDPNGLVYHQGVWHCFYQASDLHAEDGPAQWHTRGWGHAVSDDLVRWRHLPPALHPTQAYGAAWSGSGLVDTFNVLGLQEPDGPSVLCLFFTGSRSNAQYMAFSTDAGRHWRLHPDNPVVPPLPDRRSTGAMADRDPKVLHHPASSGYVMVLFYSHHDPQGFVFLHSEDLLHWTPTDFHEGFFECPDLFELPARDDPRERLWVLVDGDGTSQFGTFDGRRFQRRGEKQQVAFGDIFATQTWNQAPDDRRVQTAWLRWKGPQDQRFPGMPFSQMQTLPCDLTLRGAHGQIRLHRYPVPELQVLRGPAGVRLRNRAVAQTAGRCELVNVAGDHFDVLLELEGAVGSGALHFAFQGADATIRLKDGHVTFQACGQSIQAGAQDDGVIRVRMLIDRNVLEAYLQDGLSSISVGFLSSPQTRGLVVHAEGSLQVRSLDAFPMRPYWHCAGKS